MTGGRIPADPSVFHITHIDNLECIVKSGRILSHAAILAQGVLTTRIGYEHIKQRRLRRSVPVAAGGQLGEYVPFYFCPRSVMLYVIHKANSPGLEYSGGQRPIVHLASTARALVAAGRPWAFTDRHADIAYAQYHEDLARLDQLDWRAIESITWGGDDRVRERKQAEFLVQDWCPLSVIHEVGVISADIADAVARILTRAGSTLRVKVHPDWYY